MPRAQAIAPIHPGEILLEEFLNAYDPPVTQIAAAERMHIPAVRLNQLIRGNRGVSPDTALRLSDLTGTTPEFWLHLQTRYDLWRAQRDRAKRKDAKIRALPQALPRDTARLAQQLEQDVR
jgi:addiction module HigA family antidote